MPQVSLSGSRRTQAAARDPVRGIPCSAYCVVRLGHIVDECPLAAGNRQLAPLDTFPQPGEAPD